MGIKAWLNKHLGWFDRQIENYPSEARTSRPPVPPTPVRRSSEGARGPAGTTGPVVRRSPAPPSRAPRHRLDEDRRRPDSSTDIDPGYGGIAASAAPYWIDEPAGSHHDHRHHGHAVDHSSAPDTGSSHTTHHHGGGWGDSGGHTSHDSGSSFGGGGSSYDSGSSFGGGGYDGGGSSCGGGGGD
jgi:hypothetical protein